MPEESISLSEKMPALVILAGGAGTRLGLDIPKPMADVGGKPILQRQIELAARHGVRDVILLTGHKSDVIENYFGDGASLGVSIEYVREDTPLGTAGAFSTLRERLPGGPFLVFYGDVAMDFDVADFVRFSLSRPESFGTLIVHPNDHPADSDLVEVDATERVTAFHKKPHPAGVWRRNLSNAAVYCLSPAILDFVTPGTKQDWAHDVFPRILAAGKRLYAYNSTEYFKDMGTPERLAAVRADYCVGVPARRSRARARPAVFLDRDGVLMPDIGNLADIEKLELIPGAAEAVRLINQSGRPAVVVTNQPVIAKGGLTEAGLEQIHAKLETLLGLEGAYLDRIYYCPHHPEGGFDGERADLKIVCACRKPAPGMILRAARELNLDLENSILFGDRESDVAAGAAAGVGTNILLEGDRPGALLAAVRRHIGEAKP